MSSTPTINEHSSDRFRSTRFIDACWGRPTDCTPVWLMRQAGRYQASYRELRQRVSFFDLCSNPELAAQVTCTAADQLGTDAAIIFSDILVPAQAMGVSVDLTERGPVITPPVRNAADVDRLVVTDPTETIPYVMDSIQIANKHWRGELPIIGFAGAPFTLACYLVEGGHSKSFHHIKSLLFNEGKTAHQLLDKLAKMVTQHLLAQVEAGCRAIQVFDSWAGVLSPRDYATFGLPYTQQIMDGVKKTNVPKILFGTNTATLLPLMQQSGADVIGIDWRVDLNNARQLLGQTTVLQGNLDPCCLFMDRSSMRDRVADVLRQNGSSQRLVFNLGHGVLPETPEQNAKALVDMVHELSQK